MRNSLVAGTLLLGIAAYSQTVADLDPQLTATPTDGGVLIQWQARTGAPASVTLRRRDVGAASFSVVASNQDAGLTSWFVAGPLTVPAEFHVQRGGNGWVMAGVEAPFREDQGVVMVVVDAAQAAAVSSKLIEWEDDLRDDGWVVLRETLNGSETPPQVKAKIAAAYATHGARLRSVFLLGRVPRAFSGNINPDGHPDHRGAWPADLYYADLDGGQWTDTQAVGVGPFFNDAGDGKFDPSFLATNPETQVGRADFEGLPAFGADAGIVLIERYLDKAHAFRTGQTRLPSRVLVDDNFGYFGGEAFSRVAFRDGTAITGRPPDALDFFTTLNSPDGGYLLAFGCGGGTSTGAGGVGSTTDFVNGSPNAIFVGLFGSYFGDWNYSNNFLRAALATKGPVLASTWFARPASNLHSLAALETFGDAFNRGIIGQGSFVYDSSGRSIHQALLGDPTLRLFYPPRVSGLTAVVEGQGVRTMWSQATGPDVIGHHVFRRIAGSASPEVRVTVVPIAATTYLDLTAAPMAMLEYRAVAVVRQTTGSGTFWNHSLGMRASVTTPAFIDGGMMVAMDAGTADAGMVVTSDAGLPQPEDAGTMTLPDGGSLPPLPLPMEPKPCGCSAGGTASLLGLLALVRVLRRRG